MIALSRTGSHLAAVAIAVSRDGDKFRSDRPDTTIAVWDSASERPIRTVKHKATQDLVLSPDGRLLAAWDDEGEITVWTLPDGKELHRFRVGPAPVACLAFGRDPVWQDDGSASPWLLAVGQSSGLVTIWDLHSNRPRSVCRGSNYRVSAMDFSADGALLLTAGRTPTKLWDVATGACLLNVEVGDEYRAIAFAPDGRHFAASFDAHTLQAETTTEVRKLELGHGVRTLHGLQGVVERTTFSPDGRFVAAATHEWQIGIWEWPSGRLLGVLPAPIGQFADNIGMAFDADGRRFACSIGHEARLWDLGKRRLIGRWALPEGTCDSLAFPGEDHLLLVRQETQNRRGGPFSTFPPREFPRVVRLYDLLRSSPIQPVKEITEFDQGIQAIRFAPNGSLFAVDGTGSDQGKYQRRFHVYEGSTGRFLKALPTTRAVHLPGWFFFDPSAKVLAAALEDEIRRLSLFELPALTYRGMTNAPVACVSPAATWSLDISSDQPQAIVLSEIARGQPLLRIVDDFGTSAKLSFGFSPDGRHAVIGRTDGTVSVLDLVEINRWMSELHLGR